MAWLWLECLESRVLLAGTVARFGVIGDYGDATMPAEADVANLVKSWNPDYILTVGDNNYPDGAASTIDDNIGQFFHEYIFNYQGTYGPGSPTRRFLPSLGNHDWDTPGAQPYLDYFDLPGNERYYEFAAGPVRFFLIDTDPREPHGVAFNSTQGQWLQQRLAAATEPHKVVLGHHSPYSSGVTHGSQSYMQWPFKQWGATAVLTGHDHVYERLNVGGLPYFIDGLGGRSIHSFAAPVSGSELRFNDDFGAMLGEADASRLRFKFYTRADELIDTYTINATDPQPPKITVAATDASGAEAGNDPVVFTFTRAVNSAGPITVNFTLSGSATSGSDFSIPTSIVIPDGATSATLTIRPIDDAIVEGPETIVLTLAPDDNYNRGATISATATIADNDSFTTLLAAGSTWNYLDNGSDQGTAWREPGFDDSTWASGPAQLGYGDGDEATVINGGPKGNRFITSYFRGSLDVADASKVGHLQVRLLRDDGAVIYINGMEVWRDNMPSGAINFMTLAVTPVPTEEENIFHVMDLSPGVLVSGNNVIAVEVHQVAPTSSDVSFDLSLHGTFDTTPPAAPSRPDLDADSDSGIFDNDDITNDSTPTFSGTAEPGSLVRIYADGIEVGSGVADNGESMITTSVLSEGSRTITATATDDLGNSSPPSDPLGIIIDTTGPAVILNEFRFDSIPMSVAYAFDEPVDPTFSVEDLLLENLTTSSMIDPSEMLLFFGDVTIWLQFPGFDAGILPDGDYRATLLAAGITDVAGNPLAANQVLEFFFLQADASRDRHVTLRDFNILAANFGQMDRTFSQGDFNYDGLVNLLDFGILANRFGAILPPSAASFGTSGLTSDEWISELLK